MQISESLTIFLLSNRHRFN